MTHMNWIDDEKKMLIMRLEVMNELVTEAAAAAIAFVYSAFSS